MCVCCVCVSPCSENKRKREGGESGGLFAAVLSARGLSLTVSSCHNKQTVEEIATASGKPHFPATPGDDYTIQKSTGSTSSEHLHFQ